MTMGSSMPSGMDMSAGTPVRTEAQGVERFLRRSGLALGVEAGLVTLLAGGVGVRRRILAGPGAVTGVSKARKPGSDGP
jgi:hypothetical protein